MNFKKLISLSITCLITTLPIKSIADLTVFNYTNEDSSVKVTSGTQNPCSMDAGVYTPKVNADGSPGTSYVTNTQINILCISTRGNICTANIYATKNCSGNIIGTAAFDLTSKTVTQVKINDPKYIIKNDKGNGTILELRYS